MTRLKSYVKSILPARLRRTLEVCGAQNKKAKEDEVIAKRNTTLIQSLLANQSPIQLELGAGANRGMAGWTYVDRSGQCDLIFDLTKPFPFPSNSVDRIYSSHLLEHFHYTELTDHLRECLRILKPEGQLSAAVPNARIYLDAYHGIGEFDPEHYCRYTPAYVYQSRIDYVNYMAYMAGNHRYMFDTENLVAILENFDFVDVRIRDFDPSIDLTERQYESIYAIASKPPMRPCS